MIPDLDENLEGKWILGSYFIQDLLLLFNFCISMVALTNDRGESSIDKWESNDADYHSYCTEYSLSSISAWDIPIADSSNGCNGPIKGNPVEISFV